MTEMTYQVSTYPSEFLAYQSKRGMEGLITNFIARYHYDEFNVFVAELIGYQLVERVCLERAFNKIKLKNRCKRKPTCAPHYIASKMIDMMILNKKEK
jgi:hypothetical protein